MFLINKVMSDKIKGLFNKHLLNEADDDVFRDRRTPSFDSPPNDDGGGSFEGSLDPDTDPNDFDVDGLGFDEDEVAADNFAEIYQKTNMINDFYNELVGPDNDQNLTRLLALGDRNDSVANGLLQQLKKPVLNMAKAAGEVKAVLDQVAASEPALRKKIKALNSNG